MKVRVMMLDDSTWYFDGDETAALKILHGPIVVEKHDNGDYTLHPVNQIKSVKVLKKA